MELRLAGMDDLPELRSIYKEIICEMRKNSIDIWDEIYPCAYFQEDIEHKRLYLLTEEEHISAAFALCTSNSGEAHVKWRDPEGSALYLDRLGINVADLRKGIGTLALEEASKLARQTGAAYLRLFVVDINIPAIRLYQKNGFCRADGSFDEVIDEDFVLHEFGYEKTLFL